MATDPVFWYTRSKDVFLSRAGFMVDKMWQVSSGSCQDQHAKLDAGANKLRSHHAGLEESADTVNICEYREIWRYLQKLVVL